MKNADIGSTGRSVTNHDFAEDLAARVVLPRRLRLGEGKYPVDDRVHRLAVDRTDQGLHVAPAPDADATERGLAHEQAHEVEAGIAGRERTNERDFATVGHRLDGLCERPGST